MLQAGFPDLYTSHARFGIRWIEVKLPDLKGSSFTKAQLEFFPMFTSNGSPIWILTAASDTEYRKLFQPFNVNYYLNLYFARTRS